MKKTIFLIAAFVFAAVIAHAQTEKGSQTLGASLGFSYNKNSGFNFNPYDNSSSSADSKSTNFTIGPSYSYFIADKLDLGATVFYNTSTSDYTPAPNNLSRLSANSFGGMAFLRKYFLHDGKIGVRTGPYIGYDRSRNTLIYSANIIGANQNNETDNYRVGGRLDLVYFPSKRFGFSATLASLDYVHYKTDAGVQGHASGNTADLNLINNNLQLSVFYAFGSK